jgi:hypothetical protein
MAKMKHGTNLIFAIIAYLGYTLHWYAKSIGKINGIRVHFLFLFIWAEADAKMGKGGKWMPIADTGWRRFFRGLVFWVRECLFPPAPCAYIDTASFPLPACPSLLLLFHFSILIIPHPSATDFLPNPTHSPCPITISGQRRRQ